jgi:hypothetical protein
LVLHIKLQGRIGDGVALLRLTLDAQTPAKPFSAVSLSIGIRMNALQNRPGSSRHIHIAIPPRVSISTSSKNKCVSPKFLLDLNRLF